MHLLITIMLALGLFLLAFDCKNLKYFVFCYHLSYFLIIAWFLVYFVKQNENCFKAKYPFI